MTTTDSRQHLTVASTRQVRAVVGAAARPHRARIVAAFVLLVGGAGAALVTPRLMGSIVDLAQSGTAVFGQTGTAAVWLAGAAMLIATVLSALLTAIGFVLMAGAVDRVIARLRERVIDSGVHLPLGRLEKVGPGDLIARTTDDVTVLTQTVNETLPSITGAGFAVAVTLVGMAALDWRFSLIVFALAPVYYFALRRYRRQAPEKYLEERRRRGRRAAELLASIRGLPTVRAFGLQNERRALISEHSWAVVRLAVVIRVINNRLFGRVNFAEWLGMALLLGIGFQLVRIGDVTVGMVTAATLYFLRLFGPIGQLMLVVDPISSATASLQRVVGVIVEADELTDGPVAAPVERARGDLRAERIRFSYGGRDVLHDVDLDVAAGSTVAVVGASGAGKSTLAAILAGARPAGSGTVRLDGADTAGLDPAQRARQICLVTQDVHVFAGPLRDDLLLARPEAGDDELLAALDMAGARTWAEELEGAGRTGLDVVVGAQGVALTPVQAQQVALARVALLDPPVVILDEATAEAGSAGAAELEDAAERITQGRTAVVIAHRLAQAARADEVVLMSGGRISERGPHSELAAAGGAYAELWAAWSRGRADADTPDEELT
ncbi:ABC transporter related protein OS=Tsukamurella paurometabola (strain ATCC 8368 / DSM / CCUG 35730 / CIP 100753 / JCM 10117 / KCTC 9821 / NBRC 16120 / NCIMB 702349 / NCTC 13040) OX=521096 GN=Tpau_3688 PE=4 SV=1 [Tsukamurella paurometabola]|uniref:ABC transporter related protein n=1 Tax=Tsukamurella paurometabola (strain ATCC 8368 / DSM 20162 / CCUG 35730 / CIP 100753 / JCM 10117 / KCTC 9821 / NBRC 16120 / NCIMB 702349 / NCTC 13040) TaxID=521096 RepID=D5UY29_TSUPD|nr:ABC transporter ATP-binding protein [Tsukamurella paurometabola]ADG80266.1 ABC transporter related protein [Tsukamurella paurometabola DSM 20162]SUP39068.1 Putative multidrug export ATP-binding/permease protein SAV1866 [Tsukamurella paurometabola]